MDRYELLMNELAGDSHQVWRHRPHLKGEAMRYFREDAPLSVAAEAVGNILDCGFTTMEDLEWARAILRKVESSDLTDNDYSAYWGSDGEMPGLAWAKRGLAKAEADLLEYPEIANQE